MERIVTAIYNRNQSNLLANAASLRTPAHAKATGSRRSPSVASPRSKTWRTETAPQRERTWPKSAGPSI